MTASHNLSTLHIMHDCLELNGAIASAVLTACKMQWQVPDDVLNVTVTNGWVTLKGEMEWPYQREAAGKAAMKIAGVKGLINQIAIKSKRAEEDDIIMHQYD